MRKRSLLVIAASSLVVSLLPSVSNAAPDGRPNPSEPLYLDAKAPIEKRVEDLLAA